MFLYAEHFVWHDEDEKYASIKKLIPEMKEFELKMIIFEVGFWRKANHIHAWFVENCQDGVDECQMTFVEREQLEQLLSICKEVKGDHNKGIELLPRQEGFFFGDGEYNEWYFKDIDNTIKILEKVLKFVHRFNIYYRSSW